ncbi:hypothetical protein L6452_32651 [Arctium lappa]|uniref:Uncharacterized protein n=1 Tax=Arctium lappa TaxID=4217 RepID=A0ACB8Z496_ARCLA|nr:hypothetical protein L6452_32651 [Arctium lappa]
MPVFQIKRKKGSQISQQQEKRAFEERTWSAPLPPSSIKTKSLTSNPRIGRFVKLLLLTVRKEERTLIDHTYGGDG